MPELGSRHSFSTVRPAAFTLFQNIQWATNTYHVRAARRECRNTFFEGGCISQHKIENNPEMTCSYALQGGLQIEVMYPERLIQLFIRSYVTPTRHFDECIERYVEHRRFRAILKRLGQAAFSRAGRSVQYDRDLCHMSRRQL
ncbi:hypothetical protein F01_490158 [Burkholderia cenocepacia]|nr:hypothetical protein F01_490158 [Burkholderia cenocepacia]